MLVICRRVNESIIIGEGDTAIKITLTAVAGGKARIGIKAPKEIKILREELISHDKSNVE